VPAAHVARPPFNIIDLLHGFYRRNFTDRRQIWLDALPISQTVLLNFWGS